MKEENRQMLQFRTRLMVRFEYLSIVIGKVGFLELDLDARRRLGQWDRHVLLVRFRRSPDWHRLFPFGRITGSDLGLGLNAEQVRLAREQAAHRSLRASGGEVARDRRRRSLRRPKIQF